MSLSLAILISGRGSNFQAIHQAILEKRLDATVSAVISDQPAAGGLEYAGQNKLPMEIIARNAGENRESHNARLLETLQKHSPDWIALAGYMRILGKDIIRAYSDRIVNIHPSLLPAFPGLEAQRQALDAGVRFSGCTVHLVDEGCDTGPIIDQRVVPVLPDDSVESLSARILVEEHRLYPQCLQLIAAGKLHVQGRRVLIF